MAACRSIPALDTTSVEKRRLVGPLLRNGVNPATRLVALETLAAIFPNGVAATEDGVLNPSVAEATSSDASGSTEAWAEIVALLDDTDAAIRRTAARLVAARNLVATMAAPRPVFMCDRDRVCRDSLLPVHAPQ